MQHLEDTEANAFESEDAHRRHFWNWMARSHASCTGYRAATVLIEARWSILARPVEVTVVVETSRTGALMLAVPACQTYLSY